jgi:hypothetical protein
VVLCVCRCVGVYVCRCVGGFNRCVSYTDIRHREGGFNRRIGVYVCINRCVCVYVCMCVCVNLYE